MNNWRPFSRISWIKECQLYNAACIESKFLYTNVTLIENLGKLSANTADINNIAIGI